MKAVVIVKEFVLKVLIIGINGFIGDHVASDFEQRGYDVIGIDRFAGNGKHQTDIFDVTQEDIDDYLKKNDPDIVINCAGQANVPNSVEHPEGDLQENTVLVHKILFAMKQCGMASRRFIQLSSAAVYGNPDILPVKESSKCKPLSPYALHKKMSEDICEFFNNTYGFNIITLRIFSVYGPGLRKQIFWDLYQKVKKTGKMEMWGTGDESRDYIYIDDLTEVIYLAATVSNLDSYIWNVASGKEVYIKDIADKYAEVLGVSKDRISFNGIVREGDPLNWCADISELKKYGFKPRTDIEAGIKNYVDWITNI